MVCELYGYQYYIVIWLQLGALGGVMVCELYGYQ